MECTETSPVTIPLPTEAEKAWVVYNPLNTANDTLTIHGRGPTIVLSPNETAVFAKDGKVRLVKGTPSDAMVTAVAEGRRGSVGFNSRGEPVGEEFGTEFPVDAGDTVEVADGEFWRLGIDRKWSQVQR